MNTNINEPTFKEIASRGGKATLKKYGKDHFKKLAEKSVAARKKKQEELDKESS